ncbi:16S rRNA (uracil(1498)-N(3))-methyltransferase [Cyanobacterium sp. uoEpiScrs1]|uniref:16S rRNA (uracil(1498)-N(3))-methyltransferase n=1 Tax=Cyanobacterium sp. uoEpiScrs1 TaxID=2976343 RepID=UPI00226A0533|nr:16S rRNA (uracil(1498)-N(3))-methyltransferase [Cyanobacterium sp. uoEpiScrs1]
MYRLVIKSIQHLNQRVSLNPEQQHYLRRVLRLNDGDNFVAMNGQGQSYLAQLTENSAQILEIFRESTELPIAVTLIIALPKGNGFNEIVRCCTELGVTTLIPIISKRTLLKPSSYKLERWRKIATEAAEQSERQIVPTITEPIPFDKILTRINKTAIDYYICVPRKGARHLLTYLANSPQKPIVIATGCEGGWTQEEVEKAVISGFQPVTLGRRILRAITAPVVALSLVTSAIERELMTTET